MKKIILLIPLILSIFIVSACTKDESEKAINENKVHSMEGIVKEISEETFLMESRDRTHLGDVRVSLKAIKKDKKDKLLVGDIVKVNYDGIMSKSEPAQIAGVYSVDIVSKAKEVYDKQGNKKENEVVKEDYRKLPLLSVIKGDNSRVLSESQSAFMYDLMKTYKWDKKYEESMNADYTIVNGGNIVGQFDYTRKVIFDSKNKVAISLDDSISKLVHDVLEDKKK